MHGHDVFNLGSHQDKLETILGVAFNSPLILIITHPPCKSREDLLRFPFHPEDPSHMEVLNKVIFDLLELHEDVIRPELALFPIGSITKDDEVLGITCFDDQKIWQSLPEGKENDEVLTIEKPDQDGQFAVILFEPGSIGSEIKVLMDNVIGRGSNFCSRGPDRIWQDLGELITRMDRDAQI